jgi:hypothetical protein
MRSEQYANVLDAIRAKYAVHYTKLLPTPPSPSPALVIETPAASLSPDASSSIPILEKKPTKEPTPPKPGPSGGAPKKRAKWPM